MFSTLSRRKVTVSAVHFVEQLRVPVVQHHPTIFQCQRAHLSIRYPISAQEAVNALVTSPESRVSTASGDDLYPGGSEDRLPLDNAIKKNL
ncbi:hypothetical protein EVAR_95730_1 [Eumeta japonica]|uniref:Uncharacterized protein n=1 Tax=Eumeta variegata TaxID=151549 RepID=A0A4C1UM51_EUMVA|nr:hypothetical protein EVAR_95730_1 [Eumeta japonica]